jgi:hypothetical protein
MSHSTLLLLAVFPQVALTFGLLFWLGPARVAAVRRGEVRIKDIALGQSAWPDRITQISRSFQNQFELPVLFYVLVGLVLVTHKADVWLAAGAWLFVLSRLLHAFVHVTSNSIQMRFQAYVVGAGVLVLMWLWLALRVMIEGA